MASATFSFQSCQPTTCEQHEQLNFQEADFQPTSAPASPNQANKAFCVPERYNPFKEIGVGAYGIVVAAVDNFSGDKVAIKKVTSAFEDIIDAKRVLREIKLMRHFDHNNVVFMHEVLSPQSLNDFQDVYIVSELMESDLHRIIYSDQELSDQHISFFTYQILCALRYVHSAGVIHRDLKPQNLLINSDCEVKLCDFGLARSCEYNEEMTEYVVTRWYRPPEIIFCSKNSYGFETDIWSLGCILAELILRKPLFPGDGYLQMADMICYGVGRQTDADVDFVSSRSKRYISKLKYELNQKRKIQNILAKRNPNPNLVDLVLKMLQFNPDKRISIEGALQHPAIKEFYSADDICDCEEFVFEEESEDLGREHIKELIFREIAQFNPAAKNIVLEASRRGQLLFPLKEGEFSC